MMEILVILTGENDFYDHFANNMPVLVVSICMNLIQTTESEAQLIMNDPQEFVNLAIDCCDKQKS